MFSPYYAWARRRRPTDPLNHVCINAILYTRRGKHWAMTERGSAAVDRSMSHLAVGNSRMAVVGRQLVVSIDEITSPLPRRLRGTVTVDLGPVFGSSHELHANGSHQWRPIAPMARATVAFDRPALQWTGHAYVDMNVGSEPLEKAFRSWTWSRQESPGSTRILYDVVQRDGRTHCLALDYRADGSIGHLDAGSLQHLPATGWRVARSTRTAAGQPATLLRTLEDTPFYARSLLRFDATPHASPAVHESVDLDRFASRWVQVLLPFKMPRRRR